MARIWVRNLLFWLVAALFYAATFRGMLQVMDLLQLKGGARLLAVLGGHLLYGLPGYFLFRGAFGLRAALLFAAVMAYAIVPELLAPVRGYPGAHLLGQVTFGMVVVGGAALSSLAVRGHARWKQRSHQ